MTGRGKWQRLTATDGVSVVIPHFGEPAPTASLANSFLSEVVPGGIEVIISDDCSPRPFTTTDERIQVVRGSSNGGFGTAVNRAAKLATKPWLLIANSDIEIASGFVQRVLEAAEAWQPAVCGVRISDAATGHHAPAARKHHRPGALAFRHTRALARFRNTQLWRAAARDVNADDEVTGPVEYLVGTLLLLPREAFIAVGGFDEKFFMYAEEADLQRRLKQAGVPSILLADFSIEHRGGESSGHLEASQELLRSHYLYVAKWAGPLAKQRLTVGLYCAIGLDALADTARRARGDQVRPIEGARSRMRAVRAARRPRSNGAAADDAQVISPSNAGDGTPTSLGGTL